MNWTGEQIKLYNTLLRKIVHLESWVEIVETCLEEEVQPRAAASESDIRAAEETLGRPLPLPLAELYRQCDGISTFYRPSLFMPLQEVTRVNGWHRNEKSIGSLYMPFDSLLFFGAEGGGDYFAFPIAIDGSYGNGNIFQWDHETDSRFWKANNMKDLIARLATDWSV